VIGQEGKVIKLLGLSGVFDRTRRLEFERRQGASASFLTEKSSAAGWKLQFVIVQLV
jgi:hypothetical protein